MNVLILSPHIDDGVLGCGGTISKIMKSKNKVNIKYIVFAPDSPEYVHEILHNELINSIFYLSLAIEDIVYCDFETRYFPENRQKILDFLYKTSKQNDFDIILTPSRFDVHQDHETITDELLRVYKRLPVTIYGYELVLNTYTFETRVFSGLSEDDLHSKISAYNCFESQKTRKHLNEDLITSNARVRGAQMGVIYAEAFESIRTII